MKLSRRLPVTALLMLGCTSRTPIRASDASTNRSPADTASPASRPGSASPGVTGSNPFEGATLMLNPEYVDKVRSTAKAYPADAEAIQKVAAIPTSVWLDTIASVARVPQILDLAEQQQLDTGKAMLSVFVVYDLPNRDCSAKAAAGELSVEERGEERYKTEFIDRIAAGFAAHPKQRIVAILEPDSLPNMATNLNVPKCAASDPVYRRSIAYAISKLNLPNVSIYLDAAHAGWLGWGSNSDKIAKIFKDVLTLAGGTDKIRGFATNVSNYNTVSGKDGKILGPSNPTPDEQSYITHLTAALDREGITGKQFIIDTARNGKVVRGSWSSWCNIKGAGLGPRPVAAPMPLVDAFLWVKPPGESDGTTDEKAARFDVGCKSVDSMPSAPEGGQWFAAHFVEMVRNAMPKL